MDQDSPLSCLLVGRPTLGGTMRLAVLAALELRTALRCTMPGMTSKETTSQVAHHLKIAGCPDQLFTEDALTLIHTSSRGYVRAVTTCPCRPWAPRSPPARTSSTRPPSAPP
ncbi:hypothetical protein JIX56_01010 [Streptomyces sp. CA-210063]|uniref:hypothetical protein n=1 Tax=Streptomyces sp. CA-210063 TaxID=2801029 RepID=UPI00214A9D4D|nr:hypothetical protein [Streptomyces sp. CA-210063]UUU28592.1 hypothetical protein JIX56_01010 [Streptomyces sp. CA-210063]